MTFKANRLLVRFDQNNFSDAPIGKEFSGMTGEYCVVKHSLFDDECYLRGVVEGPDELIPGNFKINLIDYGITRSINRDVCFPHVSLMATDCQKAYGSQVLIPLYSGDQKVSEKFNELCGNHGFPCSLKICDDGKGEILNFVYEDTPKLKPFVAEHFVSDRVRRYYF